VAGCELLGFGYLKNEAVFVLDIPFIWAIATDGSMDLGSSDDMSSRLELDDNDRTRLTDEALSLRDGGAVESNEPIFAELPSGLRVNSVACVVLTDSGIETTVICDRGKLTVTSEDNRIHVNIEQ